MGSGARVEYRGGCYELLLFYLLKLGQVEGAWQGVCRGIGWFFDCYGILL